MINSFILSSLLLTLSAQADVEDPLVFFDLLIRPAQNETIPSNSQLFVVPVGDTSSNPDLSISAVQVDAAGTSTEIALTQVCVDAANEEECLRLGSFVDLIDGNSLTLSVTSDAADDDYLLDLVVGPEDNDPPPAIQLPEPHVSVLVSTNDDTVIEYHVSLEISGTFDSDIVLIAAAELMDDGSLTSRTQRLVGLDRNLLEFLSFTLPADQTEVCLAVELTDLAGNTTRQDGSELCRELSRETADAEVEVTNLSLPGCSSHDVQKQNLPFGVAALLFAGLIHRRSRNRRA